MDKVKSISKEEFVMGNEVFLSRKGDGHQVREMGNNICRFLPCLSKPTWNFAVNLNQPLELKTVVL